MDHPVLETAAPSGPAVTPSEPASRAARLLVRSPGRAARVLLLDRRVLSIGSDDACWLPVRDSLVPPVQCLLVRGRKRTVARNLDGTTLVNGRPLEERELRAGDVLQVGRCTLEYQEAPPRSSDAHQMPNDIPAAPAYTGTTVLPGGAATAQQPGEPGSASAADRRTSAWPTRDRQPAGRPTADQTTLEHPASAGQVSGEAAFEQEASDQQTAEQHESQQRASTPQPSQSEASRRTARRRAVRPRTDGTATSLLARLDELELVLRTGVASLQARDDQLDQRLAELSRRSEELGAESARQAERGRATAGAQHEFAARFEALVAQLRAEQRAWQDQWNHWREQIETDLQQMGQGLGRVQKQLTEFRTHQAAENRQRASRHDALFEWQARIAGQLEQLEERIAELRRQRLELGAAQHERAQLSQQFAELQRAVETRLDEMQQQSQALAQRCEQLAADWQRQWENAPLLEATQAMPRQAVPGAPEPIAPQPQGTAHLVSRSGFSTYGIDWEAQALRATAISGRPEGSALVDEYRQRYQPAEPTEPADATPPRGADSARQAGEMAIDSLGLASAGSNCGAAVAARPHSEARPVDAVPAAEGSPPVADDMHPAAPDQAYDDVLSATCADPPSPGDAEPWSDQPHHGKVTDMTADAATEGAPHLQDDRLPEADADAEQTAWQGGAEPSLEGAGEEGIDADEPSPDAVERSTSGRDATGEEPHEETIEEYMARLLGRVRALQGEAAQSSPRTVATQRPQPARPHGASLEPVPAPPQASASQSETSPAPEPVAMRPRGPAPESSANMAVLRELANANAQQALAVHSRARVSHAMKSKLVVSIVSLLSSFALMWCSATTDSALIYAASVASLLIAIVYGVRYLMLTGQLLASQALAERDEPEDSAFGDDAAR
jgi:hypothetical protein